MHEIRSAATELLTSQCLQALKGLIQTTYEERQDISGQLAIADRQLVEAENRYSRWERGFLFKHLFKQSFLERKAKSETAKARRNELDQQLRLTTITAKLEMTREQAEPYFHMCDEFAALSECVAIWDKKAWRSVNKVRERTIANEAVDRESVKFSLGSCDLISWGHKVPHLQNTNGGDLFLYPGFVLYRAAKHAFSVIDFHEITLTATLVNFVEHGIVPSDSQIVGQTWAKANKDGSRDRRFVNNRPVPLVRYTELSVTSEGGLREEFQLSNPSRLNRFVQAWNGFVASFEPHRLNEEATDCL